MRRSIVLNPIESAPLSFRAPAGIDINLDIEIRDQTSAVVDMALLSPWLEMTPRSGGAVHRIDGAFDQEGLGSARYRIPGSDFKDINGYRLRLLGTIDGGVELFAFGAGIPIPGTEGSMPAAGAAPPPTSQGFYNLQIVRSDSYTWQFTLWGDTAKTIASDLTGCTVTAQIRQTIGGTILANMPCEIQLPVPPGNIVWMSIESDQTQPLPSTAYWDMQVSYPDGSIKSPISGRVVVIEDVTRPP